MSALASKRYIPYLLLAPGLAWLLLFFVVPLYFTGEISLQEGTLDEGFRFTWNFNNYTQAISGYQDQFLRSFLYSGVATVLALLISYPLAYTIAFRGGKWKNALLLLVVLPSLTTYLVRTLAWQTILDDASPAVSVIQFLGLIPENGRILATSTAVIAGITYNFMPFMILPLYASLERINREMVEASNDLYAGRMKTFLKVTLPLSMPGVVAGSILTFIPAVGDYINAQLLGTPKQSMIGNIIQSQYLVINDYPVAAALSFTLMALILVMVFVWIRAAGKESVMGSETI